MKRYKIKFTEYQKDVFKMIDFNGDKKRKLMSVYSYLIKYSNENGVVTKSLNKLYNMYIRHHKNFSRAYFYNLVGILSESKLVVKNKNIVVVDKNIDNKIDKEKDNEAVETTQLEEYIDLHNREVLKNKNLYTNTNIEQITNDNIIEMLKNHYKGISGKINASKNDLIDIAKCLCVVNRVDNALVQYTILHKIHNSKQKINIRGAVAYVMSIVMEKLGEFDAEYRNYYNFRVAL